MSGGGTAGHIYPALTVAEQLASERSSVLFVGTPNGLEARLVPAAGVEFRALQAAGFDRSRPWTLITSTVRIALSSVTAWRWMGEVSPDVVIGFGGYVSLPVGLAAVVRRIPLVLHEQNSVPGLANKVLSRWARAVGVTYQESRESLAHPDRAQLTGNPVRRSVLVAERARGRADLGVAEDETMLLVFGGSRGARHLNGAMVALAPAVLSNPLVRVVHVAGPTEAEAVRVALRDAGHGQDPRWRVLDYLDDMGSAIAAADLVIARAGATSIAELTALGAACVLVPYPYATDDHQTKNAAALVDHGAAVVFSDAELDDERFGDEVLSLLGDPARRATMSAASRALGRPDAASRVVALAAGAAGTSRPTEKKQGTRVR